MYVMTFVSFYPWANVPPIAALIAEPESYSSGPDTTEDVGTSSHHSKSPKKHRTSISKRLSGRSAPISSSGSSLHSISKINSYDLGTESAIAAGTSGDALPRDHVRRPDHANRIISQVAEWLQQEKAKQAARRPRRARVYAKLAHASEATTALAHSISQGEEGHHHHGRNRRSSSDLSDSGLALERLEEILSLSLSMDQDVSHMPLEDKAGSNVPQRKSSRKLSVEGKDGSIIPRSKSSRKLSRLMSRTKSTGTVSDSDARDEESVPSAEVTLDNSKALKYRGGAATSQVDLSKYSRRAAKEEEPWMQFKQDIVRLIHTLKISGWRGVNIEQAAEIEVERLSGALTNAVYVVTPPERLSSQNPATVSEASSSTVPRKKPK